MLQKILDTAAERNWQVTSVNLDSLTEATFIKLLTDLDYKKEFQIIIDCELERLNSIINLVKLVYSRVFAVCAYHLISRSITRSLRIVNTAETNGTPMAV